MVKINWKLVTAPAQNSAWESHNRKKIRKLKGQHGEPPSNKHAYLGEEGGRGSLPEGSGEGGEEWVGRQG